MTNRNEETTTAMWLAFSGIAVGGVAWIYSAEWGIMISGIMLSLAILEVAT